MGFPREQALRRGSLCSVCIRVRLGQAAVEGGREAEEKLIYDAGLMTVLAQRATKVPCVGLTSQPSALGLYQSLSTSHPMKTVTLGGKQLCETQAALRGGQLRAASQQLGQSPSLQGDVCRTLHRWCVIMSLETKS